MSSYSTNGNHHLESLDSPLARSPTETPLASRKRGLPPGAPQSENRRRFNKVSRACDACKKAKSRCTGTVPCDNCTRKRIDCVYDAKYSRGRPPTPPPADQRGDAGFRANRNEDDIGRTRVSFLLQSGEAAEMPNEISQDADETQHSRGSPELEVAEIEGQLLDPSSALTFLHRAWKRLASQRSIAPNDGNEKRQMWMAAGDEPFDRANQPPLALPDKATCSGLLAFYFDTCVVTYRFLHRPTVIAWLDVMYTNSENNLPLPHGIGNARTAIILTLMAISTIRQAKIEDRDVPESERLCTSDLYFCTGRDILSADDFELGLPRLESAQVRLIQVLYLLQTSRMNQGWYLFGSCLQIISALGLHRKSGRKSSSTPKAGASLDYIALQYRKRTFWVAYTIDSYLGVVFGRPRHYHDDDVDQDFPDSVNDEDMTPHGPSRNEASQDCHVDSLIFHAKLARIIGDISREVYSTKDMTRSERLAAAKRLSKGLQTWRSRLPPHLGSVRPSTLIPSFRRQAIAMALAHAHAVMHANRPFLMRNISTSAAKECISAATKALQIVDSMAADGTLFHALWWTHYVIFCALAVVYVLEIQEGAEDSDDSRKPLFELAERCHSYLARDTAANSPSRRYGVILEELRMEAKHQSASLMPGIATTIDLEASNQHTDEAVPPFDPSFYADHSSLWSDWQTTNWLDLDSSAFGPLSDPADSPLLWTSNITGGVSIGQ